jgi:hypothetical protein
MLHHKGAPWPRTRSGQERAWNQLPRHVSCTPNSSRSCCAAEVFSLVPEAVVPPVTTAHPFREPWVERGQSENATGLSGLRLTDNEKMSGRA